MNTQFAHKASIAVVLLLAAVLRFYGLGDENLWLDEALSWGQATMSYGEMMQSVMLDVHPPLYFNVLYTSVNTLGDSEFFLRLPSAVFGLLAVWMVYLVGIRLGLAGCATAAALLAAIAVFQIQYAQEVRMYSMTAFFSVFSMYTFLGLYKADAGRKEQLLYLVASALLMYSHVFGLFIIVAQNAYALGSQLLQRDTAPVRFKQWFVLQFLLGLMFLPWVGVLLGQMERVQGGFWITRPTLRTLWETFELYAGGYAAYLFSLLVLLIAVSLAIAVVIGKVRVSGESEAVPAVKPIPFLLLWLLLPVAIPFLISLVSQPIYYARYTIGASLAWYLLVALAICFMQRISFWRWPARVLFLAIIAFQVAPLYYYYENITKTPWETVVGFVEDHAGQNDVVLVHNFNVIDPYSYYAERDDLARLALVEKREFFAQDSRAGIDNWQKTIARDNVIQATDGYDVVWIVLAYSQNTEYTQNNLPDYLADEFSLVATEQFGRRVLVQKYLRK
jgi:mannosyltransferase